MKSVLLPVAFLFGAWLATPSAVHCADAKHWAFQPPVNPTVPSVKNQSWARSPIDRFILAELEAKGLQPARPADARALIRRVTFDLTGLPPTPDDINDFVQDSSKSPQGAYEKRIDRLLASPHYGERWGRHWLDVARYADSNGLDENVAHGNAWRYRDYVVAAFNADKPYDQFLREQIAGDLLAGDAAKRNERLVATGFLSLGPKVLAEPDEKKMEMDIVDEQVDTLGRTVLGLTLGCARCHDHKFDPLSQDDYYGLAGIFMSTRTMEQFRKVARWHDNPIGSEQENAAKAAYDRETGKLKDSIKSATADAEKKRLRAQLAVLEKKAPIAPTAMGVSEAKVVDAAILLRGNHLTPGKVIPRHFPSVLSGSRPKALAETQSGRLELAEWLTAKDHPLTARVMVNRLWRWHFGQGLVRSVDNFGRIGEKPSHPQLLDWLAVRFVEEGWSIKKLHRTILLSSTYRMGTAHDPKAAEIDAENRLLWRMSPRRLEAEEIRDALLGVSGSLDRSIGGPVLQVKNRDYLFDHTSKDKTSYESKRRSLYLPVIRNHLYDVFQLFDTTDATVINGDRATTTVATQALFWMNSPFAIEAAEKMTAAQAAEPDFRKRLRHSYLTAYGREPTESEYERMERGFKDTNRSLYISDPDEKKRTAKAWALIGQVILSANEFIYLN
jgi:hypothetical protein